MAIELLTDHHKGILFASFQNCKHNLKIVTPFLSKGIAEQLVPIIAEQHLNCTLITRFKRDDFIKSSSSIDGLYLLFQAGTKILALKNLHTKLYLIDENTAIMGSANFTIGGLKRNHELSLLIQDEAELLKRLNEYFFDVQEAVQAQTNGVITEQQLLQELEYEKQIDKNGKKEQGYVDKFELGANLPLFEEHPDEDPVQQLFNTSPKTSKLPRAWIKFEASSGNRAKRTEMVTATGKTRTNFSRRRIPTWASEGDILFIAKHSKDSHGKPMPIIVARAKCHKFQLSQKVDTVEKWPYYLELYDVETIEAPISEGIELQELIHALGCDTYVHTVGDDRAFEDLMHSHRQQARLELTEKAKAYLDARFEDYKQRNP